MTAIIYEVIEHDGGWAYKVGDTFSETFPSHDAARFAATKAATEHEQSGPTEEIEYQDPKGEWHVEHADGRDRPHTQIKDGE